GREDVDAVDALEVGQLVFAERRLRTGPENAGVVDEEIDPLARRFHKRAQMPVVADVAWDRGDFGDGAELASSALEIGGVTPVDDERPASVSERAGKRQPEAAGGAGDDC